MVAGFDVLLEVFHVLFDFVGEDSEFVGDVFDEAVRVDVHLCCHSCVGVVQAVEGDHTCMVGPCIRFPGDAFVGVLFCDGGVEFSYLSGDFEDPMCVHVVGLSNFPYSGHEVGERFELGPLVVGGTDGDVDINGFGHGTHKLRATHSDN